MIGAYTDRKNRRSTFAIGMCETCGVGGKIQGSVVKDSKEKAMFILSRAVPLLFEKQDITGRRYDRLCGPCIERIELIEAKRAGEKEVPNQ